MENPGFELKEADGSQSKSGHNKTYGAVDGNGNQESRDSGRVRNRSSRTNQSPKEENGNHKIAIEAGGDDQVREEEDDPNLGEPNIFGRVVVAVRSGIGHAVGSHKKKFNIFLLVAAALLYNAYLIAAIHYAVTYEDYVDYCNGVGILIVITGLFYWSFFYYFILKRYFGKAIKRSIFIPIKTALNPLTKRPIFSYIMGFLVLAAFVTYIVLDAKDQPKRLISAGGILVILAIGLLLSKHPGQIKWSMVMWGIGIQMLFGILLLKWDGGREAFKCLSGKVAIFLDFTSAGSDFVYGYLSSGRPNADPALNLDTIFVFKSLSVIFFFSFFISLLYHYGVMMWIVTKLGWLLQITIGSTAAESMNASANIFVGQTEAPILIKPFLADMTKSELCAVMTGGFATIAGSVMGAYISFGINPSFLLSASIMAAPAALAVSKLIYPETKISRTTAEQMKSISLKTEGNALDAAAQGAAQGVMLIGNIVANVIAFMAFIAFLNAMTHWFGVLVGWDELSFEYLLGKVFIPISYALGVDAEETEDVALLLGLKTVVNEFVAYQRLITMKHLSCRSQAIATYALCSFSNFSSIGIQLGGIGFMAPQRRQDLAETITYAFIAGSFCGLLNACIAGMLIDAPGYNLDLIVNGTFTINCD